MEKSEVVFLQVRDVMNQNIVTIDPTESAALAARLLARHNVGALPVCSANGRLQGIVTDRDIILRCVAPEDDPSRVPVKNIMTRHPKALSPADDVRQAAQIMAIQQVRRLPVVEGRRLVGMVSLGDLSQREDYTMEAAEALSEITANIKRL